MSRTVKSLGEFGLISRLLKRLGAPANPDLLVGPGDDAAVWRSGGGYTIATTDTMVDGVHFLAYRTQWQDVGWKALATNISDIAAMGGTPRFALVTLCLPPDTPVADIDALYDGLGECASVYGVTIAGGDIVSASVFAITIALMGDATLAPDGTPLLLRRDAARPGDVIAVTGTLGGSSGGLIVMRHGHRSAAVARRLTRRHFRPTPRVGDAHAALAAGVRCAMDISDGLVQDLGHICQRSKVAAQLQLPSIPIDSDLISISLDDTLVTFGANEATVIAATGGEDYELILIGRPSAIDTLAASTTVSIVGRIVEGSTLSPKATRARVHCFDDVGREVKLGTAGYRHFEGAAT